MIWTIIICLSLVGIILWACYEGTLFETLITLFILGAVVSCNQSNWWEESERQRVVEQAAKDRADATPRVIREADGCKVYTFKAGEHWHYFTRCATSTTTESHRTETTGSGKNRKSTDVAETITTDGAK